MASRIERRKDRVKAEISIFKVLADFGYQIVENDYEQQFCCDLHGDGQDVKPSARVYSDNSWYCFACSEQRDSISTVQEKEELGFGDAIYFLERKYGLGKLPWEDDDEVYQKPKTFAEELDSTYSKSAVDYPRAEKRVFAMLDGLTKDQSLPLETLLGLWDVYDKIAWSVFKELMSESKGSASQEKLREKILERVKGK